MLKLIYSLNDKEITLKYNKKSFFWSRELLMALSIYFALHLVLYILFHIKSIKPLTEEIIKPGFVTAEVVKNVEVVKKNRVDDYGFIQKDLLGFKNLPSLSIALAFIEPPLVVKEDEAPIRKDDFFKCIEKINEPIISPILTHYRLVNPIQIQVLGPLSKRCMGLKMKPKKVLLGSTETLFVKFKVHVEDKTGHIFSSEMIRSSGSSKYDHYALNILKNIEFEKKTAQFITSGEVEFLIEAEKRDIYD